jgi:hypothetical protein
MSINMGYSIPEIERTHLINELQQGTLLQEIILSHKYLRVFILTGRHNLQLNEIDMLIRVRQGFDGLYCQ